MGSYTIGLKVVDDDGAISYDTADVAVGANNPPVISSPNPGDKSKNILITETSLSIYIADSEGDTFDWTIQTNPILVPVVELVVMV
jgi:hypothetical protein